MGYDIVQTEAVSEFRDVFVALRNGLPLVFGELLFEQKCTVVVATPNLVAVKNDFPRSHLATSCSILRNRLHSSCTNLC